jgi:PPOX class probable F420-dependent enzyme
LESPALAHVATIGPHGEPQNNLVWFGWYGEHVMFSQTAARQKYRNVQCGPRVAFSIVDPENPYRYLEIRGEVDRIEDGPNLDFINSIAKKYLGLDTYPHRQPGDERVVIFVRPEHTTQMGA